MIDVDYILTRLDVLESSLDGREDDYEDGARDAYYMIRQVIGESK